MLHTGPLNPLMCFSFRAPQGLFLRLVFQHVCASVPLNLPSETSAATVTVLSCSADALAQDDKRLPENANKMIDAVSSWSRTLFPLGQPKPARFWVSASWLLGTRGADQRSVSRADDCWRQKKKKKKPSGSTWIMWLPTEDKVQGLKGKFQWNIR